MNFGTKIFALGSFVFALAITADATAQHSIRASHYGSYYSSPVYSDDGCCGGQHCAVDDCCDTCCQPCLCLPNPCRFFDKVGTALCGLKELFRCHPCCSPCGYGSNCCGVIDEQMPYLEHQYPTPATEMPPTPETDPAPTPANDMSAHRAPGKSPLRYRTQQTRYRRAMQPTTVRRPVTQKPVSAPTRVKQTSYTAPARINPTEAQPLKKPAGGSVRIVKPSVDNPLR